MFKPFTFSHFGIGNNFTSFSKQVCIFLDGLWFDSEEFKRSEVKVLVSGCEPPDLYQQFYTVDDVIQNHSKFDLILAAHPRILSACPNAVLFPFGSSWVAPDFKNLEKRFELSFICGPKNSLAGHKLRHQIWSCLPAFKSIPIKAYFTVQGKDKTFDTSQFAIIVENTKHPNYFTEKLVDSLVTRTVPLYWGCPNVGDYFNLDGILRFESFDELLAITQSLDESSYAKLSAHVEDNAQRVESFRDYFGRVSEAVRAVCER